MWLVAVILDNTALEFQWQVYKQTLLIYTKYAQMSRCTDFTAELLRSSVLCPTIPIRLVSSLVCISLCLFLPLCLAFPVPLTNDLLSSFLSLCLAFVVLLTNDLLSFLVSSPPARQLFLMLFFRTSYNNPL